MGQSGLSTKKQTCDRRRGVRVTYRRDFSLYRPSMQAIIALIAR